MNALQWWVVVWAVGTLAVIYAAGWVWSRCPRWFLRCTCRQNLPGPTREAEFPGRIAPTPRAGELHDEWEQLDPDQAAEQLIAEWKGPRGLDEDCADGLHEYCLTAGCTCFCHGNLWDEWWAGVDGLERECMLVHDWLVREERLWAELKAETRELCAA